jgi:hypothetical protein
MSDTEIDSLAMLCNGRSGQLSAKGEDWKHLYTDSELAPPAEKARCRPTTMAAEEPAAAAVGDTTSAETVADVGNAEFVHLHGGSALPRRPPRR